MIYDIAVLYFYSFESYLSNITHAQPLGSTLDKHNYTYFSTLRDLHIII